MTLQENNYKQTFFMLLDRRVQKNISKMKSTTNESIISSIEHMSSDSRALRMAIEDGLSRKSLCFYVIFCDVTVPGMHYFIVLQFS
jgi:alanyl-tRNA synthetase